MIPKIKIAYNRFLDPIFLGYIKGLEKHKDWVPPTKEEVIKRVKNYKALWAKYEAKVLPAMVEIFGHDFKRNQIDVHIVSGNPRGFSTPVVLKSGYSDVDFINCLIHELIHCLFADNCNNTEDGKCTCVKHVYPHENKTVENHVFLHAMLQKIYLDVLNEPERMEAELAFTKNSKYGYDIAWKIVEEKGYQNIIDAYKKGALIS